MSLVSPSPWSSVGSSYVWNSWSPRNLEIMSQITDALKSCSPHVSTRQRCLCLSLLRSPLFLLSLLRRLYTHRHSSGHLLFFTPIPSPSLPHLISLHPILCVWAEGSGSLQARFLLWRPKHHLSFCGEGGNPWWPAHRWRYNHHRPNGKTARDVRF